MAPRKTVRITGWPDPLVQERIEDMGFFLDQEYRGWIRFCDDQELPPLVDWLKRHQLPHQVQPARGRGELKRLPRLSDQLVLKDGGSPTACALCGTQNTSCRQWIEGDDTDSVEYPNPIRFFLCGACVQTYMQPHPRLYAPADDQL